MGPLIVFSQLSFLLFTREQLVNVAWKVTFVTVQTRIGNFCALSTSTNSSLTHVAESGITLSPPNLEIHVAGFL